MRRALFLLALAACNAAEDADPAPWNDGKADGFADARSIEVLLTEPYCDVCTADDKAALTARSQITQKMIGLIDGAQTSIDIANYTFSVRAIEEAIERAKARGIAIRVAMDKGQETGDTVATRLREAGVDVRFVAGGGEPAGLQHAKYMLVDGLTLATGSNNWSSTGTTINEESTLVIGATEGDPLPAAYACHFEAIWAANPTGAGACSTDEVKFSPSSAPIAMLKDELRRATTSIDVLMHHLVFDDLQKELAKAAERGVRVRVIANAEDRAEYQGPQWTRLLAAGGEIRFKQTNPELFQLMHHKLAIVDDRVVLFGSGNWSGSAFFKNFENYLRFRDPRVARPYRDLYARLWTWSLSGASLDAGLTAAQQHAAETQVYFGNLHAHVAASQNGITLDDGHAQRADETGTLQDVDLGATPAEAFRTAFEYARDRGGMDFLALSPHTTAEGGAVDPSDNANMSKDQWGQMVLVAHDVTRKSEGGFVAIPSMEWNTNSAGNHVTVLGTAELAKIETGRYDRFYASLNQREREGDHPLVSMCHPRTFRSAGNPSLEGNWDQIFDVSLTDIPSAADRSKKFNDYGLDDFEPMRTQLPRWIAGEVMPDRAVVSDGLAALQAAGSAYVRLFEVLVGRGTDIKGETRENASLMVDRTTGQVTRFTRVHSDWDYYLLAGFQTAPTAPHDNHYANWGTGHSTRTGVIAEALTEASLLAAIDQRAVYASEDEQLVVRLYADDRVPMGGTLVTRASSAALSVFLEDSDYSGDYEVAVFAGTIGGDAVTEVSRQTVAAGWQALSVDLPTTGAHFVYLEILEPGPNRMAWSAPIWITRS